MSGTGAVGLAEAKAYLRIAAGDEDALIGGLIDAATGICEAFLGQVLIRRSATEEMPAPLWWRWLGQRPVTAITAVAEVTGTGTTALPAAGYAIDIDGAGDGLVRVTASGVARIAVTYTVGLAEAPEGLPPAVRQGIVRLVAHLHAHRDAADEAGPPAAVAALWRPYRRVRL